MPNIVYCWTEWPLLCVSIGSAVDEYRIFSRAASLSPVIILCLIEAKIGNINKLIWMSQMSWTHTNSSKFTFCLSNWDLFFVCSISVFYAISKMCTRRTDTNSEWHNLRIFTPNALVMDIHHEISNQDIEREKKIVRPSSCNLSMFYKLVSISRTSNLALSNRFGTHTYTHTHR